MNNFFVSFIKQIEYILAIGEYGFGCGTNQIGNLQRSEAIRWSSHYEFIKNLIDMYAQG